MTQLRALIADDHPLIIEGLTLSLGKHDIEVVGQAATIDEVIPVFEQCRPDVVVLDVAFGQATTGLDVARLLLDKHSDAKIIFYSQFDQDEIIRAAYRLGGRGFVTKNKTTDVLIDAIKQVHAGMNRVHLLPEIAERLAILGLGMDDSPRAKLEARELDVFRMIAQGQTTHQIGEALSLSPKTISGITQTIKSKLGVQRSVDMARLAVKHRIIEP
jgi:two-component system, NarL family, invasion response regulator UvrY